MKRHGRLLIKFTSVAMALVASVAVQREARAGTIYGLASHSSGFSPTADSNGFYAYVNGSATNTSGPPATTTIDFLVSAALSGGAITEFGFNSSVSIPDTAFKVYAGTSTSDPSLLFNVKNNQNVSEAGTFSYDLGGQDLASNTTQNILVEFTVSGTYTLSDFVNQNSDKNYFVAHLKPPLGAATGFVFGGTPTTAAPEPSTLVGASVALVGACIFASRRRKLAMA